jgi:hypothetical protein
MSERLELLEFELVEIILFLEVLKLVFVVENLLDSCLETNVDVTMLLLGALGYLLLRCELTQSQGVIL